VNIRFLRVNISGFKRITRSAAIRAQVVSAG
jgi:hypothetical protein